jgi:osmotically-inducible protein OsmY
MRKLFLLFLLGTAAVGGYNYSNGRDILSLPSTSAVKATVRETVGDAVSATTRATVRHTTAEVKERASDGVHSAVNRTEEAVLTPKIKAKMALDDLVKASDINVDTDGSVVTLTGNVGSKDEQRRAVRIATETAGVTKVVNHLRVR